MQDQMWSNLPSSLLHHYSLDNVKPTVSRWIYMVVFSSAVGGAELEALASWDVLGYVDTVQCSVM